MSLTNYYKIKATEFLKRCVIDTTPGKFHYIGDIYFSIAWDKSVIYGNKTTMWKVAEEKEFVELLVEYFIKEDLDKIVN